MTELYSLAVDAATGLSIAELHGVAVGLAITDVAPAEVAYALQTTYPQAVGDIEALEAFTAASTAALDDPQFHFMPLLPDDDEAMSERLAGLVDWVSGFLAGAEIAIGTGRVQSEVTDAPAWPEEVEETIRDLLEISRVEIETEESETEESDYMQLVEYVRAGVLLMKACLEAPDSDDAALSHGEDRP